MQHYFANVQSLGNVAVSRHAQNQLVRYGIPETAFTRALLEPTKPDILEGSDIIWRERDGLRIVILANPVPFRGAKLVKTVYRIAKQAQARPHR
jgi:hypothetical protein